MVMGTLVVPTAHAETFVFSSAPLTNLNPAGATINGGFTSYPAGAGMYIQQCAAPVGSARPTACNDAAQLWISDSGQPGTLSSKGAIALKVSANFMSKGVAVDCTTSSCGLFFRLDHTKPTDFSQDKFVPMTFAKASGPAVTLMADEVSVTLNGVPLVRNVPINLAYRAKATIVATAKSGLAVNLTSLNGNCSYANGEFVALKGSGQCALGQSTAGNATYAPSTSNYPFILTPGTQEVNGAPKSFKVGKVIALPKLTTFGSPVTYEARTNLCTVVNNRVSAVKSGTCVLTATAAEKPEMWKALKTTLKISVTK